MADTLLRVEFGQRRVYLPKLPLFGLDIGCYCLRCKK